MHPASGRRARLRQRELFVSAVKEIAAVQCKKGGFGSSHNGERKFMLLMRRALTLLSDTEEGTFVQAAGCGPTSNMAWYPLLKRTPNKIVQSHRGAGYAAPATFPAPMNVRRG